MSAALPISVSCWGTQGTAVVYLQYLLQKEIHCKLDTINFLEAAEEFRLASFEDEVQRYQPVTEPVSLGILTDFVYYSTTTKTGNPRTE
jgi:hypothetical protein